MRRSWLGGVSVLAMFFAVGVVALAGPAPSALATSVAIAGPRLRPLQREPVSQRGSLLVSVGAAATPRSVSPLPAHTTLLHRQHCTTDCARELPLTPIALNLYAASLAGVAPGRYDFEETLVIVEIVRGPAPPHAPQTAPALAAVPWRDVLGRHPSAVLQLARAAPRSVVGVVMRWGSSSWFAASRAGERDIDASPWGCERLFECDPLAPGTPMQIAWVGRDGSLSPSVETTR